MYNEMYQDAAKDSGFSTYSTSSVLIPSDYIALLGQRVHLPDLAAS